jgi:hypothetical protein
MFLGVQQIIDDPLGLNMEQCVSVRNDLWFKTKTELFRSFVESHIALNQFIPKRVFWNVDPTSLDIDQSTPSALCEVRVFWNIYEFGSLSRTWFAHFFCEKRRIGATHETEFSAQTPTHSNHSCSSLLGFRKTTDPGSLLWE